MYSFIYLFFKTSITYCLWARQMGTVPVITDVVTLQGKQETNNSITFYRCYDWNKYGVLWKHTVALPTLSSRLIALLALFSTLVTMRLRILRPFDLLGMKPSSYPCLSLMLACSAPHHPVHWYVCCPPREIASEHYFLHISISISCLPVVSENRKKKSTIPADFNIFWETHYPLWI